MIERCTDIWQLYAAGEVVCITTNGFVKRNGHAVMGRGTAYQAAQRWPDLPAILGQMVREYGNVVQVVRDRLIAFPVKPGEGISNGTNVVRHMRHQFPPGHQVPGWAMVADLDIIACSLRQLDLLRRARSWKRVYLPRPGCGAGELDWESQVRPLCEQYGDWLVVTNRPGP